MSYPEEEDGYPRVEYDILPPVAVDAIQTQQEHIEGLEAENERLCGRNWRPGNDCRRTAQ